MSVRRRTAVLAATLALLPTVGIGQAGAQSTLSDPPEFGRTTTTSAAPPTTTGTTSTAPTTTQPTITRPEITAAEAGDGILLSAEDRVELANTLAEATSESGVCFGYQVDLGGTGASDRSETLSGGGPDKTPAPSTCPKGSVMLRVGLTYTSSSSESEDSASYSVSSTAPGTPSNPTAALKDLTGVGDDQLLGDDDDLALRNLAAALPLLLDDAEPAELAAPAAKAPNGDRLTGSPGGDWIRAHGIGIGIAFALLVLAGVLVVGGLIGRRQAGQPKRPSRRTRPSSSGSGSDGPSSSTTTT
ncbi:hypothetical protein [Patulibacter sp.]|uniref:hypothetical protein n=1 Tax=Patulibacter sp. TaxID=1912859 RepID=UPI0027206838|nr:hypothetical protein [Patulibacter sp.]MDO9409435.1 hypothetical protein [Patulibacter sp.]